MYDAVAAPGGKPRERSPQHKFLKSWVTFSTEFY